MVTAAAGRGVRQGGAGGGLGSHPLFPFYQAKVPRSVHHQGQVFGLSRSCHIAFLLGGVGWTRRGAGASSRPTARVRSKGQGRALDEATRGPEAGPARA